MKYFEMRVIECILTFSETIALLKYSLNFDTDTFPYT